MTSRSTPLAALAHSVHERDHAKARVPAILVPQRAIFLAAALLVAPRAMREQADEPQRQHVRHQRFGAGAERPREVDHQLAGVVELAADAPEAGDEQLATDGLRALAPD